MGPGKPWKEESPDPAVEEVDQKESVKQGVGECLVNDQQLAEGGLEKEKRGCDRGQQWGCFAVTEERSGEPERGGPAGLVHQPTQEQRLQALTGHRSAGQMSQSHSRCLAGGWECWERSCGCPDQYLWCHCCHLPEHCGFLKSSPPLPLPQLLTGSPVDPGRIKTVLR